MDSHKRSITKGITYRAAGSLATFGISYLFTGDLGISSGIGLADVVTKVALYYVHERVWEKIPFGRSKESSLVNIAKNTVLEPQTPSENKARAALATYT